MICPSCGKQMAVTHVYSHSDCSTHRLACTDIRCGRVVTAAMILVNTDPLHGGGAAKLAQMLKQADTKKSPLERLLDILGSSPIFRATIRD